MTRAKDYSSGVWCVISHCIYNIDFFPHSPYTGTATHFYHVCYYQNFIPFFSALFIVIACVWMQAHTSHSMYAKDRGQLLGVQSFLL